MSYRDAAACLRERLGDPPRGAVLLGSGGGPLRDRWPALAPPVPYPAVGLPATGVAGHAGEIGLSDVGGERVAVLAGRIHGYEGHPAEAQFRAVRALAAWGVERVVLTSAVGALRVDLPPGSLVRIVDHLCLAPNPLIGPHDAALGPRFPDLSAAYDPGLGGALEQAAAGEGIPLERGIYAHVTGPSYETPAEIRMLRLMGGDVVGMSMATETIAAAHAGLRVAGVGVVSNLAAGLSSAALDHHDVLAVVGAATERLGRLIEALIRRW